MKESQQDRKKQNPVYMLAVADNAKGKQTTIAKKQASLKYVKDVLGRQQVSAVEAAKALGCRLLSAELMALPL